MMKIHVQGCHFLGSGRGFSEINGTPEKTYVINGIFIADDDERDIALRVANRRGLWDRLKVAFVVLFARRNKL